MKNFPLFSFLIVSNFLFVHSGAEAADGYATEETGKLQCTVDSSTFFAPYKLSSGRSIGVPLVDGTLITVNFNQPSKTKVLINGKSHFRSCDDSVLTIPSSSAARNLLSNTSVAETDMFVGAKLEVCRTADEGWFFIIKGNTGYVGYAGPEPLPLAVVGLKCDSASVAQ